MSQGPVQSFLRSDTAVGATFELLAGVVRSLVSQPERVSTRDFVEGETTVIVLTVAAADLSSIQGKDERTGRSLRAIVRAIATQSGRAMALEMRSEEQAIRTC